MALRLGQILRGARWNYLLVEDLGNKSSNSSVFKAKILPQAPTPPPGQWAIVKTASEQNSLDMLKQEHECYQNSAVRSSWHLRALYDAIDVHGPSYCLAFEWMDCTLKDLSSKAHQQSRVLHKSITKAVLEALLVLKSQHLVHTDIKNDNILISGIDGQCPTVKLGDLGLVRSEGFDNYPVQPLAMRAPEVWSGKGCYHCSDMWAFAVTLFDWISPCVFGANDMPQGHWPQPWAMAKLMRLFPGSITIHPTDPNYQGYFKIAQLLEKSGLDENTGPKCFETLSFEEELNKLNISPALAAFFRYLLVVNPMQRPKAIEALGSQQFQSLA
ncbi:Non-specific serine/threonine protein kinase [Ascochyta rabiei]|uniref:Non-specific serine/threonine protein kinase n=1 Tax=Didymella rabiei TaxID=5454 RepID=UPI0018FF1658|nr:Non-specific serine/threonine protein kinase [Ascochyta rabiei]UPX17215.1 Non-specific serine/threonine protein kinase [Ascochyta rabiei]